MFAYQKGIFPLASDLYKQRHCLGFKHNFFRGDNKSKQSKLVNTKKICVVTLDHPGSSGGERVCPVFNWL